MEVLKMRGTKDVSPTQRNEIAEFIVAQKIAKKNAIKIHGDFLRLVVYPLLSHHTALGTKK